MSISDICNTQVVTVDETAGVLEVARLMREHHVGCVIVTEEKDGKRLPIGVITDRDLVLEIMAIEANPKHLCAGDIVIRNPVTARRDDGILETLHRMRSNGVRRLPVVDQDGALNGIISADDLIALIARELKELAKLIRVEQRNEKDLLHIGQGGMM